MKYDDFIQSKHFNAQPEGFDVPQSGMNNNLFPHQKAIIQWAIHRGRAAVFADTGLGKTRIEIEWARIIHEKTGLPILILTPLCVAQQTVMEGISIGVDVKYLRESPPEPSGVIVTNYDMMDKFNF